jgi:hypothetical protein
VSDQWVDINQELRGYINYGNNLYLAYNFESRIYLDQNYGKYHRFHIMDVNKNVSYYIELNCGCGNATGGVISINRYENQVEYNNQQIMVSSRVTTDTKFNLQDFETITDATVFISEWWSTSGAEGVVAFFEELDDAIIFPDLEIDFTPVPLHNPFSE